MPRSHKPVLIAGAGPTGLTLANALAAYGCAFDIIDAKAAPERDSKALAINAASQYGFALLGLQGTLGARGAPLNTLAVHWEGRRLAGIAVHRASRRFGPFIAQPQAETERDLGAALEGQGVAIERQLRLVAATPSGDGVEVQLMDANGACSTRRYGWVIGCEGKHSAVAEAIGARFESTRYPMHFLLGDFPLELDAPPDQAAYHVWDDLFFILVPLGGGRWRVVLKRDGELPPQGPAEADTIVREVSARLGDVFRGPPVWLSRAPFYQRWSDRLRRGRMLLAGDAAHLYSPIGGTGMNTGMGDAFALAWRLAWVVRGLGPEALLDDYECLRIAAMRANGEATDRSTRLIARLERDPQQVASLLPLMRNRPLARTALPRAYSGLGLHYASLQALYPGSGGLCLALPDLLDQLHAGTRERRAAPAAHLVIAAPPGAGLQGLLGCHAEWLAERATVLRGVLLAPAQPRQAASLAPLRWLADADGALAQGCGLLPGEALLVLPDGVVGWRGALPAAWDSLAAATDALLAPLPERAAAPAVSVH
ncbi:MAG: FAD-dependent monooxygenase [Pseudomonadota bacterium]